jgi:hypothetical protein
MGMQTEIREGKLGAAARNALKALRREFRRCSDWYPPLYHEKFLPWSKAGTVNISESQWSAFQAENNPVDPDDEWFEWSGIHGSVEGFLGRWAGSPEGIKEFINLADSVCIALADEDMGELPRLDDSGDWLWLLHRWAFRHQIPLLRSDMTVWGCDQYPGWDDFYRLIETWSEPNSDGVCYPMHPLNWRLLFNVFTSSVAAIDALLKPERVITSNEPFEDWAIASRQEPIPESRIETGGMLNRFHFNGVVWEVGFEGESEKGFQFFKGLKGFHFWARLLAQPYAVFKPIDFIKADLRDVRSRPSSERHAEESFVEDVTSDDDGGGNQLWTKEDKRMDSLYRNQLKQQVDRLQAARGRAISSKNDEMLKHIDDELDSIKRRVRLDSNHKRRTRRISTTDTERQRKSVGNTLERARKSIGKRLPLLADHLKRHLYSGSQFSYEPPGDLALWDVAVEPPNRPGS